MVDRDFNTAILDDRAHRPWPMPQRPWVMTQTWHDLLFAHWRFDPAELGSRIPSHFELDSYDGGAWLSIVPFRMTNVAPRGVPSLPWVSEFPELNVRTYVRVGHRVGVYFFSLDAGSALAVRAARLLLNLPYHTAVMDVRNSETMIEYESARARAKGSVRFSAIYAPDGALFFPAEGSLEYFLTERYCLYNVDRRGAPYCLEIHHPPWPLQRARAAIARNDMAAVNGLALPDEAPLLHFAKRQDVVAWAPERLASHYSG